MSDLAAQVAEAIRVIPADDRDTWVKMAFAVKNGLGDGGFDIWDSWSRSSPRYQRTAALSTWRNAKQYGGVTIASLFAVAREHGWESGYTPPAPDPQAQRRARDNAERAAAAQRQRHRDVALDAQGMVQLAVQDVHPLFGGQGIP